MNAPVMNNIVSLVTEMALRGQKMMASLRQNALDLRKETRKKAPPLPLKEMTKLLGYSSLNSVRALEDNGHLTPERVLMGTVSRRVYTYDDLWHVRQETKNWPSRPKEAIRLVIATLKGGAGKSTHNQSAAIYLSKRGYRVLLVDLDPQATLTALFDIVPDTDLVPDDTAAPIFLDDDDIEKIRTNIRQTYWPGLDLLPAQLGLAGVETVVADMIQRGDTRADIIKRFHSALDLVASDYDFILIDTPPAMGIMSVAAITSADHIYIPVVPNFHDVASSIQYLSILGSALALSGNPRARSVGLFLNRLEENNAGSLGMATLLKNYFGSYVLPQEIKQTAEMAKTGLQMLNIYEVDKPLGSAKSYKNAVEMFDRLYDMMLAEVRRYHQF